MLGSGSRKFGCDRSDTKKLVVVPVWGYGLGWGCGCGCRGLKGKGNRKKNPPEFWKNHDWNITGDRSQAEVPISRGLFNCVDYIKYWLKGNSIIKSRALGGTSQFLEKEGTKYGTFQSIN